MTFKEYYQKNRQKIIGFASNQITDLPNPHTKTLRSKHENDSCCNGRDNRNVYVASLVQGGLGERSIILRGILVHRGLLLRYRND